MTLTLFVDQLREDLELLIVIGTGRLLQGSNGERIEEVLLTILAPLILAARIKGRIIRYPLGICLGMPCQQLGGNPLQISAADAGRGPGKVLVDHRLVQSHRLKDLGAAVALYRGDPHLGHGLDHPFDGCLDEVFNRFFVINTRQHPLLDHVIQRLKGQIGVDGIGAVAQQHRKVMYFTGFTRLQNQRNPGTGGVADQEVMQAGNRQQRRNSGKLFIHATVGQHQNGGTCLNMTDGSTEQAVQCFLHPFSTIGCLEQQRQRSGLETGTVQGTQLFKILIGKDRLLQLDHPGVQGVWLEQVCLGTDQRGGRGNDLLPDRVDRRVGHLGKQLLEIVVEQLRMF